MTLTNYWWLLIWLVLAGGLLAIAVPRKPVQILGKTEYRWSWGAGISYGYSHPVGRRLNLDFTIGVGYFGGKYKKYRHIDDCYVWQSTHRLRWFGPTKAEISLVWLPWRGRNGQKGGAR